MILLPPANEVWGKVIFLHLSVILFTGGSYHSMPCRWYPSMSCRSGGISQHALQVSRPTPRGGSLRGLARGVSRPTPTGGSPGPHPGGSPDLHPGRVSQHSLMQTPHHQLMATTTGGTHDTGMHSWLQIF